MNKQNSRNFNVLLEAVELLPADPRKQILEMLAQVENESDEIVARTVDSIRLTLGEEFKIVT